MADFSNIEQKIADVIHDNENGEITSLKLRELILDIIDDVNALKLDNLYTKSGDDYYITIGDKLFSLEPYHNVVITYSDITISSFNYSDISDLGGSSTPTVSYSQIKTTIYDGYSTQEIITTGASISYETNSIIPDATLNSSNGTVTYNNESLLSARLLVGNIKVTVSMNGKTKTKDADVYQAAHIDRIPDYYVGLAQNRMIFQGYSDSQILDNCSEFTLSLTPIFPSLNTYQQLTGINKLMYVLVKNTLNVNNIKVDINNPGETFDLNNQAFTDVFTYEKTISTQDGQYKVYWTYDSENTTENGFRIKFDL